MTKKGEPHRHLIVYVPQEQNRSKTTSVEKIPKDLQQSWVLRLLQRCSKLFGGATSYPVGLGAWKNRGRLYLDRVVVIESWIKPGRSEKEDDRRLIPFWRELARMRVQLKQKEVICILDGVLLPRRARDGRPRAYK